MMKPKIKKSLKIFASVIYFFVGKLFNSEKLYKKSLVAYPKNYFSLVHSGNFNLDDYVPSLQFILQNLISKNGKYILINNLAIGFFFELIKLNLIYC